MSGLAVWFAREEVPTERVPRIRFAAPHHAASAYRDPGVALFVAGRFPEHGPVGSYGELVRSGRHVLACEGYVFDLPPVPGGSGGNMSRGERLLHLFRSGGPEAFQGLRGGFSLVVWDRIDRSGVVVVCPFGQRSLYRAPVRDGVVFATDLDAVSQVRDGPFELDEATLGRSLLLGGVPGEGTPLKGISKVLPGTLVTVRAGTVSQRLLDDLPRSTEAADPSRRKDGHLQALDARLTGAARRLSGISERQALMMGSGVDSGVVGAYMRGELEELLTITQGMPGALDETRGARRTAAALGARHVVVPYRPSDGGLLLDEMARFVRIAGEPAYWNQLGSPLLRLLATLPERPAVFLTGAEGDHLFWFRSGRRPSLARVIREGLFVPTALYTARRLLNRVTHHTHIVASDFDLLDRRLLRDHLALDLPVPEEGEGILDPSLGHLPKGPNAMRHFVHNAWQNVRIISRIAREIGAEALFPYLDDEVASYVHGLPDEFKINKILLRLLLDRRLPGHVVPDRKMGYWAHTVRWHHERGALGPALDLLGESRTLQRGIVDPARVRNLVDAYAAGRVRSRHHPVLWQLLLFELFCREFLDRCPKGSR